MSKNQGDFCGRMHNCVCVFLEGSTQLPINHTVDVHPNVKDNLANSLPLLILTLLRMSPLTVKIVCFSHTLSSTFPPLL